MSAAPRPPAPGGFSYLLTLLAVALLGLGLSVAGDAAALAARRDREQALLDIGHEFRQALARYQAQRTPQGAGGYPGELADLLRDPRLPGTVRHLRRIHTDPMTGRAEWGVVRVGGRIVGVHSLSERAPLKVDGFDPDDAAFRGARRYRDWVFLHPAERLLVPGVGAPAPTASSPAGFAPLPPPFQR